jgi:hypothetical protein
VAGSGTYVGRLVVAGDSAACLDAEVAAEGPLPRSRGSASLWPVERVWDRETENLYSAWVEKLFDDPLDVSSSWNSLHAVTHDPSRNFLHDSLGLGEDGPGGITLQPDCADLPYFLRGYFAWKMRLPFVYSRCYSMAPGRAPVCSDTKSNLQIAPPGKDSLSVLQRFFSRSVADTAHSATGRTAAMDDHTDVYPVRISTDTLRPGAVYIDPYGHVLVIARRVEQTPTASGILLAVDAQPDGTVARKRYWRGNFLFVLNGDNSAPGFKRFRPVVPDGDSVRTLDNSEILSHPAYGDGTVRRRCGCILRQGRQGAVAGEAPCEAGAARSRRFARAADPAACRVGAGRRDVRRPQSRDGLDAVGRRDLPDCRRMGGLRDAVA